MTARTPEDCDRLFAEHVNAGDLEALLALYEPGCALVKSDGTVATGQSAIRDVMERLIAMRPVIRTEVTKVVRTGDALAIVYNDWRLTAKQADAPWWSAPGAHWKSCAARPTARGDSPSTIRTGAADQSRSARQSRSSTASMPRSRWLHQMAAFSLKLHCHTGVVSCQSAESR